MSHTPAPSSSRPGLGPHPGLGYVSFVLLIASLQAMAALGVDSMLPNLPAISHSFGLTNENQRQLVIAAYLIGFGLPQIVYGPLADRYGRRRVLLAGCLGYVAFSVLAAFSPGFWWLITARVLQGIGAAATRAVPIAIVRDCYKGRQMAKVMSLAFMIFMAVPMAAPSIGAAIALVASWRWVFGFLALYGGAVTLWVAFKLPETLHPEDRVPIEIKAMGHSFGMALRSRPGMGYAAATTFIMGALFGFVNSVQQLFETVFHAPAIFPIAFAIMAGAMALSSLLNARLVGKIGMRPLSHWALIAFIALSSAHATVVLTGHETLWTFAILQAATMFSFGLVTGNFGAMAMEPLGHVAGAASALQGAVSSLGGALVGFFIGQQFNGTAAPITLGYAICGLLALVCVLYAEGGKLFHTHAQPVGGEPVADFH